MKFRTLTLGARDGVLFLALLTVGCSGASNLTADQNSKKQDQEQDTASSGGDYATADQPVMVSGSYLTCDVDTSYQAPNQGAANSSASPNDIDPIGCSVQKSDGTKLDPIANKLQFNVKDKDKDFAADSVNHFKDAGYPWQITFLFHKGQISSKVVYATAQIDGQPQTASYALKRLGTSGNSAAGNSSVADTSGTMAPPAGGSAPVAALSSLTWIGKVSASGFLGWFNLPGNVNSSNLGNPNGYNPSDWCNTSGGFQTGSYQLENATSAPFGNATVALDKSSACLKPWTVLNNAYFGTGPNVPGENIPACYVVMVSGTTQIIGIKADNSTIYVIKNPALDQTDPTARQQAAALFAQQMTATAAAYRCNK